MSNPQKTIESAIYDRLIDKSLPPCTLEDLVDLVMGLLDGINGKVEKVEITLQNREESRARIRQWIEADRKA